MYDEFSNREEFVLGSSDTLLGGDIVMILHKQNIMCIYDEQAEEKEKALKEHPFFGDIYKKHGSLIRWDNGHCSGFKFENFNSFINE